MLLAYASKTGNIKRAITKLLDYHKLLNDGVKDKTHINTLEIDTGDELASDNCILFTYTTGIGEVPQEVNKFVVKNLSSIKGVIGSGNKNWGLNYCRACDLIFEKYNIKTLFKFELSANKHEVAKLLDVILQQDL